MALSQGDGWYFLSIGCDGLGMDGLKKVKWVIHLFFNDTQMMPLTISSNMLIRILKRV